MIYEAQNSCNNQFEEGKPGPQKKQDNKCISKRQTRILRNCVKKDDITINVAFQGPLQDTF